MTQTQPARSASEEAENQKLAASLAVLQAGVKNDTSPTSPKRSEEAENQKLAASLALRAGVKNDTIQTSPKTRSWPPRWRFGLVSKMTVLSISLVVLSRRKVG